MNLDDRPRKNKRIVDEEEDEVNSVGSNPDEYNDEDNLDPEEEDGEDLMENIYDDYVAVPELDAYDAADLVTDFVETTDYSTRLEARRAAEQELDRRDVERQKNRTQRLRDAANDLEDERELQRERMYRAQESESEKSESEEEDTELNIEAFDVSLKEWICQERTRREIKRRFRQFLLTFTLESTEENDPNAANIKGKRKRKDVIYLNKIKDMCSANESSLEVSFVHLGKGPAILAIWLADIPKDMLQIFDEVLTEVVLNMYPNYSTIARVLRVRVTDLPIDDRLQDLRQSDLNNLVRVSGVVTRRTGVYPQVRSIAYNCQVASCGALIGPLFVDNGVDVRPTVCPNCRTAGGGFKVNPMKSEYGNYQKITLQETPGSVPAGRVPRYKDVVLLGDLIDVARPGEEIDITAVYVHNQIGKFFGKDKGGFPVFSTALEANCVKKKSGNLNTGLTDEDKRRVRELAADPEIGERIIRSIAPSIYGQRHVKSAITLALFGGVAKEAGKGGTHRVRGDINILLVGDPGTAKSQFLKYSQQVAPRAVYTTGKGASAVGLTAGVHRDPITKEWTLEGGALVLADQGVCLIDEFDKMKEQDRTSIHEAMEQQTISVSKAGIVCSLQARCAVFAAANPIGGRYDSSFALSENVELTDPILQRFDILCVLQDIVNPVADAQLASFVVNSHIKSHPDYNNAENPSDLNVLSETDGMLEVNVSHAAAVAEDPVDDGGPEPLDQDILKKYITYARAYVHPVVHEVDSEKIAKLYATLREQSDHSGGVPIAVRHIESIVRMSEASARMHLRDYVRDDDVDMAIKITLQSFLQAQKASVRNALQNKFKQYLTYREENNRLLLYQLLGLMRDAEQYLIAQNRQLSGSVEVFIEELQKKASAMNIFDLKPFFKSHLFKSHGLEVNEYKGVIIKKFSDI